MFCVSDRGSGSARNLNLDGGWLEPMQLHGMRGLYVSALDFDEKWESENDSEPDADRCIEVLLVHDRLPIHTHRCTSRYAELVLFLQVSRTQALSRHVAQARAQHCVYAALKQAIEAQRLQPASHLLLYILM